MRPCSSEFCSFSDFISRWLTIFPLRELKEAFRLYDREGNGYITTSTLKEILGALDDKLTSSDLDNIITEIDTDGSGTVDFDEFMEMMTGD